MLLFAVYCLLFARADSQALLGLAEGETCKGSGDGAWICSTVSNCPHIDVRVTRPTICSFRGKNSIICCPPSGNVNNKAESRCRRYSELCNQIGMFRTGKAPVKKPVSGWAASENDEAVFIEVANATESIDGTASTAMPETSTVHSTPSSSTIEPDDTIGKVNSTFNPQGRQFVVGGHLSLPKTQRHMVLIGYGSENDITWNCGGSLISDLWVLSASHCSHTGSSLGDARWARMGELDYATNEDDAQIQDRRIVQRVTHPSYRGPEAYNDIALFKLDSPVNFNEYVAPICLHTSFDIPTSKATVIGWGRTDFAEDVSSKLMEVDISLYNTTECHRLYGLTDLSVPKGISGKTMVCAGEPQGGKDACSGDSGGPLVVDYPGSCLKRQVGITSFGKNCGLPDAPGVYTRVSAFIPWIESIVWP